MRSAMPSSGCAKNTGRKSNELHAASYDETVQLHAAARALREQLEVAAVAVRTQRQEAEAMAASEIRELRTTCETLRHELERARGDAR